MRDAASAQPAPEPEPPAPAAEAVVRPSRWEGWAHGRPVALSAALAVAAGGATVGGQVLLWQLPHKVGDLLGMAVTAVIASALSVATFRRRTLWAGPAARLAALLPRARAGEVPIEELSTVGGGLSDVVPAVQGLLHDLRAERARVAQLNDELRQRVERRTKALERRLGTLYRQATLDPLTGLRNRRLLDRALPRLAQHARDSGTDLGVLMLDVDHFKSLNDTRGHSCGDDFLRNLGHLIRSGLSDERDLAFRVGGDEFVVVRPDTTRDACRALAERLAMLSEALGRTHRLPATPRLSVGWALLSEVGEGGVEPLLSLADKRLYESKASRRPTARAS